MTKELIDRAWACLPKEFKEEVKKEYVKCVAIDIDDNPNLPAYAVESAISRRALLEMLFGRHNLTSDAEGEDEMLCVSRKKVQEEYQKYKHLGSLTRLDSLMHLFGSKCLPDEGPKPAEPKEESRNLSQGTANCDKEFDNILKNGFREHNRLQIAAMAMQGLLSNTTRFSSYEISDLVRISLNCADALITESKKGGLQ